MDSVTKNNTPAVRFEGFDGEWGAVELQQIADIVGGGTPSTSVTSFWDGDIDWYSPNEIGETAIAKPSNKRITRAGLANSSARLLPAHRTVLFTSRASIGHAAILDHPATTNQGFQSFVLNKGVDTHFFYALTSKIAEIAEQLATGSTFLEVSNKTVREIEVHVPATEEQRAIGELFSDLDALIEQHRAKHENLQQTKTALLQRMFPQDGADEPELRLGGFSGAWETTEVKHIATRAIGGGTPSRTVDEYWNGSIPWIQSSDVKEHTVFGCTPKHFISSRGLASSATSLVKGGSIAIVTRVGVGKVAVINEDYCASQDFLNLSGLQGDLTFLGVLLQSELEEMSSQTQGTSIKGLTKENVLSLSIQVPTLEEQRAIGEVFTNLDALIAAEHRYITQLTQAKTALLQSMFV